MEQDRHPICSVHVLYDIVSSTLSCRAKKCCRTIRLADMAADCLSCVRLGKVGPGKICSTVQTKKKVRLPDQNKKAGQSGRFDGNCWYNFFLFHARKLARRH